MAYSADRLQFQQGYLELHQAWTKLFDLRENEV